MIVKVLGIVLLLGIILGGVSYASVQGYINKDIAQKIDLGQVEQLKRLQLPENVNTQAQTLVERGGEIAGHTQNVLGTQITATEEKQPVSQRAFEYGRYLYCQQVVKDYETKENK